MPVRSQTAAAVTAMLAFSIAACGTTVPQASQAGVTASQNGGLAAPGGSFAAGGGSNSAGSGSVGGAQSGTATAVGSPGRVSGSSVSGSGSAPAAVSGRGAGTGPVVVGSTPVQVGFYVVSAKSDQYLASAGYGSLSVGNGADAAKALLSDVNAHGGIAGHRLVPVIAELDATSSSSFDAQAQSACATFFQDNHVAVVIDAARPDEPLLQCTTQKQVPLIYPLGLDIFGQEGHGKYPYLADPAGIDLDRLMRPYVDSLLGQQFFRSWDTLNGRPGSAPVKIGLLYTDLPYQDSVIDGSLVPALRAQRLSLTDRYQVHSADSSADLSAEENAIQGAVLKFRNDGITHVLFLDPGGSLALLFGQTGNSQHYYPRFGMNGNQEVGASLQGTVPAASLAGALGLGWIPVWDVDAGHDPGGNSSLARCTNIYKKAGIDTSKRSALAVLAAVCDGVFSLQSGWGTSGQISTSGYFAGLAKVGSAYPSALTFVSNPSLPTHSGALGVRDFGFDNGCSCFRYLGKTRRLG